MRRSLLFDSFTLSLNLYFVNLLTKPHNVTHFLNGAPPQVAILLSYELLSFFKFLVNLVLVGFLAVSVEILWKHFGVR